MMFLTHRECSTYECVWYTSVHRVRTYPLLKEYAIAFFVARTNDILHSLSSTALKQSPDLMEELMIAVSDNSVKSVENKYNPIALSVRKLRNQLAEKGLDNDGSREMLVAFLESSTKRKRDEGGDETSGDHED
jgi:hypothetical protein